MSKKGFLLNVGIPFAIVIFLLFYGTAVWKYHIYPYPVMRDASIAALALKEKYRFYFDYYWHTEKYKKYRKLWYKTNHKKSGVTVYKRDKIYPGLTFFTNHSTRAFLIDMSGNIIHKWHKPFYEVWEDPEHIISPVPEAFKYWRHARLFPNGDIIAIYEAVNQSPYGAGIVKLDKDSNIIWEVPINAHHDFDIDEQGNTHVLIHRYTKSSPSFIEDGIAKISPDGEVIRKVSIFKQIVNSKYRNLLQYLRGSDPLHTNNIEFLTAKKSKYFPMFREGDILLSFKTIHTIMVMDGKTFQPKFAATGMTRNQHDPDFLDNGNILVFDNEGRLPKKGSRVVEFDLSKKQMLIRYEGAPGAPFWSDLRGAQQILDNGNILVTESSNGRIFELSPDNEIVWEYIATALEGESIGIVNWATRYQKEDLTFLQ